MDDNLALTVGRVILAFGELDQQLWSSISMMALEVASQAVSRGEAKWLKPDEIDYRFDKRVGHFRRLCVSLSKDEKKFLADVDRTLNEVRKIERVRAHLAHGNVYEEQGRMRISDARESREHSLALRAAIERRAPPEEMAAIWERHLNITYSHDELRDAAETLRALRFKIGELGIVALRWPSTPQAQAG